MKDTTRAAGQPHARNGVRYLRRTLPAAVLLVATASPTAASTVHEIHYTMGTYFSIIVDGVAAEQARPLMRRCFSEARRLEAIFSRYDASSELSRINARRDVGPIAVSDDLADLLTRSLQLRTATAGAFDVTIGALTPIEEKVGDGDRSALPADGRSVAEPARLSSNRRLSIAPAVQLDFDGIAKGYAVDRCVALLRAGGIDRALLSLGESSQYALGTPSGAQAWTVVVRDLSGETALGTLALRDQALSVSSAMKREGGTPHIVDPRNGRFLREPAIAVVVADSATDAEAWSKAVLIDRTRNQRVPETPAALRITRRGIERLGQIAFTPYAQPRAITPDAEPFL